MHGHLNVKNLFLVFTVVSDFAAIRCQAMHTHTHTHTLRHTTPEYMLVSRKSVQARPYISLVRKGSYMYAYILKPCGFS